MADEETTDREEGVVNIRSPFVSNSQSAELMKPTQRPLDDPAMHAQTAAVFGIASGNLRAGADASQGLPVILGVVRAIAVQRLEAKPRGADFASNGGHLVDQFKQLRHVMRIGGRRVGDDGNAAAIGQNVVFTAGFSAIHGVGAR